jgi:DNA invertase Pin-like site-specific DNA recombinase
MTTKILGYGRVSTIDQEISPEVQEKQCRQWYQTQSERGEWSGEHRFIGMIIDKAVSGKVDLFKRPQGQHILATLSRGDVLVVSKLSRAFRSTQDMLRSCETFQQLGIRLVLLDVQVDTSTPTGKLMLTVLAAIAEFERELIAERTRDAMRHRMDEGQWVGIAPPGWILRTKSQTRRRDNDLIPDPDTRRLGAYCARRIAENISIEQIAAEINASANKATQSRSLARRKTEYSPKLMMVWAVYHVCGWPPLSRNRMRAKFGEDAFTVRYVQDHYSPNRPLPDLQETTETNSHSNA